MTCFNKETEARNEWETGQWHWTEHTSTGLVALTIGLAPGWSATLPLACWLQTCFETAQVALWNEFHVYSLPYISQIPQSKSFISSAWASSSSFMLLLLEKKLKPFQCRRYVFIVTILLKSKAPKSRKIRRDRAGKLLRYGRNSKDWILFLVLP